MNLPSYRLGLVGPLVPLAWLIRPCYLIGHINIPHDNMLLKMCASCNKLGEIV